MTALPQFSIETRSRNGTATLELVGELDMASAPELQCRLNDLPPCDLVVLDLRRLSFLDSTGLGALLALSGGELPTVQFIQGPSHVHKVFEITGTVDVVDWVEPEA